MIQPNDPRTGLEFYDLSATFGHNAPLWPYFEDVKIERVHYHAKSGVLSQKITTVMHCTTHADAPAHVIEGLEFTDQVPLFKYFGPGVVVSIPKDEDWAPITGEDLEKATPKIQAGDLVIINCGWHKYYSDSQKYFAYSPGLVPSAIEFLLEVGAKGVGVDQQALDHPLATAIGMHGPGPLLPGVVKDYEAQQGPPHPGRLPRLGALPPAHPRQRHGRLRERLRRGHRQGHRQARHHRRLPDPLGEGRRLHRARRGHRRPDGRVPSPNRKGVVMEVTRYDEAPSYEAPKHHECFGLRLQGFDVSKTRNFWMAISHFLPGGGAYEDATPVEKVYCVLEGEVTVITPDGEATLKQVRLLLPRAQRVARRREPH